MKAILWPIALCSALSVTAQQPGCIPYMHKAGMIRSQQGIEIYGNHLFCFEDGGHCNVYNFETLDSIPIGRFTFESSEKDNHSNQVNFGIETADGGSFPVAYVTIGKPGSPIDWQCKVESITCDGDKWSSKLVQTIEMDTTGFTEAGYTRIFGAPSWAIDRERGEMWAFSAIKRTIPKITGAFHNNRYIATKFRIPRLSEGSYIKLTADDVLDQKQFEFDVYSTQSGCIRDGKLYYSFGFGKIRPESPSKIRVYDLDNGTIAYRYELNDAVPEECESIVVQDGYIYLNTNSPTIYRLPAPSF